MRTGTFHMFDASLTLLFTTNQTTEGDEITMKMTAVLLAATLAFSQFTATAQQSKAWDAPPARITDPQQQEWYKLGITTAKQDFDGGAKRSQLQMQQTKRDAQYTGRDRMLFDRSFSVGYRIGWAHYAKTQN